MQPEEIIRTAVKQAPTGGLPVHLERRRFERSLCNFPVRFFVSDDQKDVQSGKAVNLGLGGLGILSSSDLSVGHRYTLRLNVKPKVLVANGVVVNASLRHSPLKRFGIKFLNLEEDLEKALETYVFEQQLFSQRDSLFSQTNFSSISAPLDEKEKAERKAFILQRLEQILDNTDPDVHWLNQIDIGYDLNKLHEKYSKVGHRKISLWRWAYCACDLTSLLSVPDVDDVCKTKVGAIMLNVLIDDLADKFHDRRAFDFAYRLLTNTGCIEECQNDDPWLEYFKVMLAVRNWIEERICTYPNYHLLKDILCFDFEQLFNSIRYSFASHALCHFSNLTEYYMYQSHNMNMMINLTIDLMSHDTFDLSELGKIRMVVLEAQKLVRIGNLISTWERELREGDFSNGIFIYALEKGLLSQEDLQSNDIDHLRKSISQANCEKPFLKTWLEVYDDLLKIFHETDIKSVDMSSIVQNMPRMLVSMHLQSRGFI